MPQVRHHLGRTLLAAIGPISRVHLRRCMYREHDHERQPRVTEPTANAEGRDDKEEH